jgi:hypothetical protein
MEHFCFICKKPIKECGKLYRVTIESENSLNKWYRKGYHKRTAKKTRKICLACRFKQRVIGSGI